MGLVDFIFPKMCFGCRREGIYICENCLSKVKKVKPFCPVCKKASIDGLTHVRCKTPQSLDGLVSIWKYEGVIRKAILELKYKFVEEVAKELSELCLLEVKKRITPLGRERVILVPIPLHRTRQNWRGFNQSASVGGLVAKKMMWNFAADLLIRKHSRQSQTELDKEDRKINIRGVFSLNPHNSSFIIPDSIVLFDDVWTTGSTMKEACKVLRRNGAQKVWGLTICS